MPRREEYAAVPSPSPSRTRSRKESRARSARATAASVLSWVEAFLKSVGVEEPKMDDGGWFYISFGGTSGRVGIVEWEGDSFLRVEAMVLEEPGDKDLILPLHHQLLQMNYDPMASCRFALDRGTVFLCDSRQVDWLEPEEVAAAIDRTMRAASSAREELIEKYGGTTQQREKRLSSPATS